MRVIERGHIYEFRNLDGDPPKLQFNGIVFVNREEGMEHGGTQTQEVLRALIDRTYHCHKCLPHRNNEPIVYHLRMALALHESRALERKAEKGLYLPEQIFTGDDGHFTLVKP